MFEVPHRSHARIRRRNMISRRDPVWSIAVQKVTEEAAEWCSLCICALYLQQSFFEGLRAPGCEQVFPDFFAPLC
ncbi:MAG: hypothetical protein WAN99_00835 [Methanoculleus sp.]